MDFQAFQSELGRLGRAATELAAFGAALRARQAETALHPDVAAPLDAAVEALAPDTISRLDAQQVAVALRLVTLQLEQALDLFKSPERSRWEISDPAMLQAQGQASRIVPATWEKMAAQRPALAECLRGRFLDVGTGVAALALEAAHRFPDLQVTGLDIWPPALALARENVAASPFADRIEIRDQDVTLLDEPESYSLAWLPTMFMPRPVVEAAVARISGSLRPGGHIVLGLYPAPPDPAGAALHRLRVVRSGGHDWQREELRELLRRHGFVDPEIEAQGPVVLFHFARKE